MPKTICLDFDGVLHSYKSGWQGPRKVPDGPVPGAIDFLLDLLADDWDVAIFSARSHQFGGRRAMKRWLRSVAMDHFLGALLKLQANDPDGVRVYEKWSKAGLCMMPEGSEEEDADCASAWLVRQLRFPLRKPPAIVTLDDRAICFDGDWPDLDTLNGFKPWNRS